MEKRRLGPDGPLVSCVGVGAMSFAGFYGETTDEQSADVLATALDLGIDHIDTAYMYGMGHSERVVGKFLADYPGDKPFTVATKGGIFRDEARGRYFDNSQAALEGQLDTSLKNLGLDAIDLYYIHRRDQTIPIEEVTETLAGFIKAGKIKAFGYSEIAPTSLRRAAAVHPVAAVQSEYSLSTRSPDVGLTQATEQLGTALVAFSPVGRGLLTDTPLPQAEISKLTFPKGNPRFTEPNHAANLAATDKFRALAKQMGVATASLAIAWLKTRGPQVISIPGTRTVAHLKELAAGGEMTLSAGDLAAIDEVLPPGWAHGDRYSEAQWTGPERYC